MQQLFYLLLLLACPLGMVFMMRGMNGGGNTHAHGDDVRVVDATAVDNRVTELEREVSRLRGEQADQTPPKGVGPRA